MKKILFLITAIWSLSAQADLLDRIHLEEALQERAQDSFKMYDDTAKILIRLDYHSYDGGLPGTNIDNAQKLSPDKIELMDISKATVIVYTSLEKVSDDAKEALYRVIPLSDKKKIELSFKKFDQSMTSSKPVEVKDLSEITEKMVNSFSKSLFLFLVIGGVLFFGASFYQNTKRMQEFKEQFKILASAVTESGDKMPVMPKAPASQSRDREPSVATADPNTKFIFENWTTESLRELFADAYWSQMDNYAHWLWKNLKGSQKSEILAQAPFMKDYCNFFMDVAPLAFGYHEHPYYLEPLTLWKTSQEDLSKFLKKDISLWHGLSPLRKQTLPLTIDEKLSALQSKTPSKFPNFAQVASELRTLHAKPTWGELSSQDELMLFNNPTMVPTQMRSHIRSLVWLAKKDKDFIQKSLAKFDARALAYAWVGPEEVLKVLETHIPEKKLKLLQTYKAKVESSRQSEIYQLLVDEGLSDEAA